VGSVLRAVPCEAAVLAEGRAVKARVGLAAQDQEEVEAVAVPPEGEPAREEVAEWVVDPAARETPAAAREQEEPLKDCFQSRW
jgi:hypothetical protein